MLENTQLRLTIFARIHIEKIAQEINVASCVNIPREFDFEAFHRLIQRIRINFYKDMLIEGSHQYVIELNYINDEYTPVAWRIDS